MKEGLIFANARAKAKEHNFISEERLRRMIEAKSLDEAVRILFEVNYAGGMIVDTNLFYSLLYEEEKILYEFIKEVTPEGLGMECFFLRSDYHNLKVLCKEKFGNILDAEKIFSPYGLIPLPKLIEQFKMGILENPNMNESYQKINKLFEDNIGTPRVIDVEIDKAMFDEIDKRLKVRGIDKSIKKYFEVLVDSTNILIYLRTLKIEAGYGFFASNYVNGGTLKLDFFEGLGGEQEKLEKGLKGTIYKDFYDKASGVDLALYETEQDNYLLRIFATEKSDMMSAAPLVGYYLGKLNEIKVIRVILVCKKNNVPHEEMMKRVRTLYI